VVATGPSDAAGGFRADIQGLRAIAVLLVLVFHLWPRVAPGGYVGVDVFFVISGYLMTGLLVREAERSSRVSLPRFYARRIRRLLPAASATLVLVGVASLFLLSPVRWDDTAAEITASAFYAENWWLASESVDYLALEEAPSPVQHFWSLSVEEQFYIAWPLLIMAVLWLARRTRRPLRQLLLPVLAVATAASLAYSVVATLDTPAPAYFSTGTRFWELGLGGLLVLAPRPPAPRVLAWGGLAAVAAAAVLYGTGTAFPGHAALLPTVGTAAVILAARPGGLLALRPMQYLGGISYSLYLWHWPLIVFYLAYRGEGALGPLAAAGIAAAAILLAHLSKVFVEDPVRRSGGLQRRLWRSYAVGVAAAAACAAVALLLHVRVEPAPASDEGLPARDYPGAAALSSPHVVAPRPIRPTAVAARREHGMAHGDEKHPRCIQDSTHSEVLACDHGDRAAPVTIALVGDSHAEHWLPALDEAGRQNRWRVVSYMKDSCLLGDVTVYFSGFKRQYTECDAWRREVERALVATRPTLVIVSQAQRHRIAGDASVAASVQPIAAGLRATWRRLAAAGLRLAVIAHTPIHSERILECMAEPDADIAACSTPRKKAFIRAALTEAVRDNPDVLVLDMTDQFCPGRLCLAAIGNVLTFRDSNHITTAYSRTLAPVLARRLIALVPELAGR
jgi:peptidoglycan/LPS O-acetylase OafA/YrhL